LTIYADSELVIWRPSAKIEEIEYQHHNSNFDDPGPSGSQISQQLKNTLRGRTNTTKGNQTAKRTRKAREYSPASDDDNDGNDAKKKSKRLRKLPAKKKD
jgi:hypothetical protein